MFEEELQAADIAVAWFTPLGWKPGRIGQCRSCRAPVQWCTTPSGKPAPVDVDGTSHFATCPQAVTAYHDSTAVTA